MTQLQRDRCLLSKPYDLDKPVGIEPATSIQCETTYGVWYFTNPLI